MPALVYDESIGAFKEAAPPMIWASTRTNVIIKGAPGEIITITRSGGSDITVTLNSEGISDQPVPLVKGGNYSLQGSISNYSIQYTIDSSTTEIACMPHAKYLLYWYGYSDFGGITREGYQAASYSNIGGYVINTNNVYAEPPSGSSNLPIVGTAQPCNIASGDILKVKCSAQLFGGILNTKHPTWSWDSSVVNNDMAQTITSNYPTAYFHLHNGSSLTKIGYFYAAWIE